MTHRAGAPPSSDTGTRARLAVLRTRDFGPYFLGNTLSNAGTWFQSLAAGILVYRLTGSALQLGIVGFSQFIAVLLLAPWTGAAADRFDRRKLMLWMQVVSFAVCGILAGLAWVGDATAPVVIGLSLVLGLATAFAVPAFQTLSPLLVPPSEVRHAIALTSVMMNASRVLGPSLGAVVISGLGIPWAFSLNAGSYLILIAALLWVRPRPQPPRPAERIRMRDTLRELLGDRRIAALLVLTGAVSFAVDPPQTLAPAYAREVLHRPDTVGGYLIGCFGAGAVVAGFTIAGRVTRSLRRTGIVAGVFGLAIVAYALSPGIGLTIPALVVGGAAYLTCSTAATTRLLTTIPVEKHGRTMAVWSALFLGGRPLASLLDGAIAASSVRVAALVLVVPMLSTAAWLVLRPPGERRARVQA